MRDDQVSRCDRCLYYFRAVGTFIFSHIGLFSLVVGYTIMGAFAFEALEADAERKKKIQMRNKRIELVESLWSITAVQVNVLHEMNWTDIVTKTLKSFETDLVNEVRKLGYDGNDEDEIQWTFSGALLYSLIVITTIGYGNVAPKTMWGKVVTILYAVVGIPLMLFCMSNIGDTMAQSFKFVYWKVCCYLCMRKQKSRRQTMRSVRYHRYPSMRSRPGSGQPSSHHSSTRSGTQGDDEVSGGGSYYGHGDDILDDVDTYATHRRRVHANPAPIQNQPLKSQALAGFDGGRTGSPEPQSRSHDANKVPIILNKYVLESKEDLRVDLPPTPHKDGYMVNHLQAPPLPTIDVSGGGGNSPRHPPQPPQRMTSMEPLRRHSSRRKHFRHQDEVEYGESDEYTDEEQQREEELDKEHVTVPIWLCCALVTGYIGGGAVLFSFWEGWNFLDSSYFCFVTLTTIGFGDLVPGKSVIHDDSQTTLALCALYLLFGMALLAMSFNLVQEQVTTTVKSIGKRIGIVDDDDDDDDEE